MEGDKPIVVVCLDGCSWDYINAAKMPFLKSSSMNNYCCNAMVPTVTNINNASILTGEFPEVHGIVGNYYYDKKTGTERQMNHSSILKCKTLLEKASLMGKKPVIITAKDKLRRLFESPHVVTISSEEPPQEIVDKVGRPLGIYTSEVNIWLFDVARFFIERGYDLVYVSTTDYVSHIYEPNSDEAKEYMERIDEKLSKLMEKDAIFALTSDHGMNKKSLKINLQALLKNHGIESLVIPIIKDDYFVHHKNLGGSVYVYLKNRNLNRTKEVLVDQEGVELVLTSEEAHKELMLPLESVGDLLVLGAKDVVFGNTSTAPVEDVEIRSHGSMHERVVPVISNYDLGNIRYNKDVIPSLFRLLT
ncbi:MAG: alkaline phosphatase family protein [Candidatus Bathyarchaeia archaeon]